MRFSRAAVAFGAAALSGTARAQCTEVVPGQYSGTPFQHSLASTHALSEAAFFKLKDPSGQHVCTSDPASDLSFLTFQSLNTTGQRPVNSDLKRAVIVVHGARNDPWNYHAGMIQALLAVTGNDEISPDTVAITAPYFPNDDDAGTGFPAGGASPAMVWYDTKWAGGANNKFPTTTKTVSAYDALDQLVQWYGDKTRFPNINQIVVSGHSMGAQMIHRYAMVGKTRAQLGITTPVSYWVGDPNSYAWPAADRPLSTGKCATFDNYREGYSNYESYGAEQASQLTYNVALVNAGRGAILDNYNSKIVNHARATMDKGDFSEGDCSPSTTGQDRNERFFEFLRKFPATCTDVANRCHTVDIVVSRHDAPTMFKDASGLSRLFHDNWFGAGRRAYDYGYPRHASFDDPYPDPAHAGEALIHADSTVYPGGKTSRGCYSDVDAAQSVGSLPVIGYVGNLNSRTYCSQICTDRGYTIAGVSWTNCYCGNQLGSQTRPVVTTSCEGPCPANSAAICGGPNRLSIFSSVNL